MRQDHLDVCHQLGQQRYAYYQTQEKLLEAQGQAILAANETRTPSFAQMAHQLGVNVFWLQRHLPTLSGEITRRRQAEQQAERQRRQVFLTQLIAENPTPHPSLPQVAQSLGLHGTTALQAQFPELCQLIMARYAAEQRQTRLLAEAALKTALSNEMSPPPSPIQVARQLGYPNSHYLWLHFPNLCHELVQRGRAYKQQVVRAELETCLLGAPSDRPLSLYQISRQLVCGVATLKRLYPELCQAIRERYQRYWSEKKLAVERALKAVLSGERTPPPHVSAIAIEFGYKPKAIYLYFPDLTARVAEKRKTYFKEKELQCRQSLEAPQPTT